MALNFSEEQQEALADMLSSPGWNILWSAIMAENLTNCNGALKKAVREQNFNGATTCVGKYDGAIGVALDAYRYAKQKVPDTIRSLQKGDTDG
jgi:hypothetical protein